MDIAKLTLNIRQQYEVSRDYLDAMDPKPLISEFKKGKELIDIFTEYMYGSDQELDNILDNVNLIISPFANKVDAFRDEYKQIITEYHTLKTILEMAEKRLEVLSG